MTDYELSVNNHTFYYEEEHNKKIASIYFPPPPRLFPSLSKFFFNAFSVGKIAASITVISTKQIIVPIIPISSVLFPIRNNIGTPEGISNINPKKSHN